MIGNVISSEDALAIEPLPLVAAGSNVQLRVVHSLQIPLAVALGEEGLHCEFVEVDHLVVQEGGMSGFWQPRLSA